MNCKKTVLTFSLLLAVTVSSSGQGSAYAQAYSKECRDAEDFHARHEKLLEAAAKKAGLTSQFLFAIAAPELTQYSHLSNRLETYSLKVFYVQKGKSYSNFSIGCFQMKPSFVELLEEAAEADASLKVKYAACLFPFPGERAARVARIDRLNTTEWQITYLSLFCEVLKMRFAGLSFATEEERLRFYASAYNSGFHRTEQQIREIAQKDLFPHFSVRKYKYGDIAVWFYNKFNN